MTFSEVEKRRALLGSAAHEAIRAYLIAHSPGDEKSLARVDSETGFLMDSVHEASYRIEETT